MRLGRGIAAGILAAAAWAAPATLPAQPPASPEGGILGHRPPPADARALASSPVSTGQALRMFLSLGGVLLLFGGGVWALRRMMPGAAPATSGGRLVEVLSRAAVGPKQSVVLVRVGSRLVLVGVTPESIRTLSEIQEAGEVERLAFQSAAPPARGGAFGAMIRGMVTGLRPASIGEFGEGSEETADFRVRREIDALRRKLAAWEDEDGGAAAGRGSPGEGGRVPPAAP